MTSSPCTCSDLAIIHCLIQFMNFDIVNLTLLSRAFTLNVALLCLSDIPGNVALYHYLYSKIRTLL